MLQLCTLKSPKVRLHVSLKAQQRLCSLPQNLSTVSNEHAHLTAAPTLHSHLILTPRVRLLSKWIVQAAYRYELALVLICLPALQMLLPWRRRGLASHQKPQTYR